MNFTIFSLVILTFPLLLCASDGLQPSFLRVHLVVKGIDPQKLIDRKMFDKKRVLHCPADSYSHNDPSIVEKRRARTRMSREKSASVLKQLEEDIIQRGLSGNFSRIWKQEKTILKYKDFLYDNDRAQLTNPNLSAHHRKCIFKRGIDRRKRQTKRRKEEVLRKLLSDAPLVMPFILLHACRQPSSTS
jgi:hypothetical protein